MYIHKYLPPPGQDAGGRGTPIVPSTLDFTPSNC